MTTTLAFETSCDETAVAIVTAPRTIRANVLHSQVAIHRPYGGIVPELASRSHVRQIGPLLAQALDEANLTLDDIDLVAATRGPGLLGALLVGMNTAQAIAAAHGLPFITVNHLHGHLLSSDLEQPMQFPALVLLVTGGHTATYYMPDETQARLVQRTVDDAVGEAFDKVAKLLGLGYPGGPEVEKQARQGDPTAFKLPLPRPKDPRAISLSGLKTAVRREIEAHGPVSAQLIADICAAFQDTAARLLVRIVETGLDTCPAVEAVYMVGGVARNRHIHATLSTALARRNLPLVCPAPILCTDNAAMIARAAWSRWQVHRQADAPDLQPQNRWEFGQWP